MLAACIKYFFLIQSALAKCSGVTKDCQMPLSLDLLLMVQHHSREVTIAKEKKQAFKSNDDVHEHCDWTCYLATYPDLSRTCGADTACAEKHFLESGQSEGRDCTCPEGQSAGAHFDVPRARFDVPDKLMKNAIEKIKARNAYLSTTDTDVSEWHLHGTPAFHRLSLTEGAVISLLAPVYQCPWTFARTNYVSETPFDGGKWTCGLAEMAEKKTSRPPCIVYSFGSNNDDFFESNLRRVNPDCEIHIFDPTSDTPPADWGDKYHFHASGFCSGDSTTEFSFGGKSYPCRSLKMHMQELNHAYIDILKIDVEGAELVWMKTQDWQSIPIGQILMEWHFQELPRADHFVPSFLRDYVIPLERAGFFSISMEPVRGDRDLEQYEVVFLNANWSPAGFSDASADIFKPGNYPVTPGVP